MSPGDLYRWNQLTTYLVIDPREDKNHHVLVLITDTWLPSSGSRADVSLGRRATWYLKYECRLLA